MRGSSQRRPARGGTGHTSSSAAAPRWSRRRASCPRPRPRGPLQTTGPTPRLPHQTQTPARAEQPPCAPRSPLIYDGDQQHYVEMATLHLRGRQHSHAPASHHSPDLSVSIFDIHARAKAGQRNAAPHERACVHGRGQAHRAPHHGPGSSLDDQLGPAIAPHASGTACRGVRASRPTASRQRGQRAAWPPSAPAQARPRCGTPHAHRLLPAWACPGHADLPTTEQVCQTGRFLVCCACARTPRTTVAQSEHPRAHRAICTAGTSSPAGVRAPAGSRPAHARAAPTRARRRTPGQSARPAPFHPRSPARSARGLRLLCAEARRLLGPTMLRGLT